ncbi:hypothetical protein WJX72_006547 [[Myrmecia] bisecta]|uniref:Uncharacterized protein n=1 Tax=[Myrmecia] bisecta TaxID=41462 RepID=A0AAW1R7H5_9CHLO
MQSRNPASRRRPPVSKLTIRHVLYLLILHCIGSAIICGAANFAIACAMYRTRAAGPYLWNISNTLAGDAGVTVIVQVILTWVIDTALVCGDVRRGIIAPLSASSQPRTKNLWSRIKLCFLSPDMDIFAPGLTLLQRIWRLICSAIRGLILCVPVFCIWWPIAIGMLYGIGSSRSGSEVRYNKWPAPELFKLVYGFTMGLVTTPVYSYTALKAMGRTFERDAELTTQY